MPPPRPFPLSCPALAAVAVALATGLGAGCDPLAPDDYVGDVLASVHGRALTASDHPLPASQMVLLWSLQPGSSAAIAEVVPCEGRFPADFRFDLRQWPPALETDDGSNIAVASINAYRAGAVTTGEIIVPGDGRTGHDEHHMGRAQEWLVALAQDLSPQHPLAALWGVWRAGFHLVTPTATESAALPATASDAGFFPVPEGLARRIALPVNLPQGRKTDPVSP